ncbi:MAG: NAD(+) synthase [Clostridia bacterium]|nr:NAD(+) synthase [Clostridia bacterium]
MQTLGFIRVAAISPKVHLGDPSANASEISKLAAEAEERGSAITLFPELSLTGYTCGDLFHSGQLCHKAAEALLQLAEDTKHLQSAIIVGFPLKIESNLYNCAGVIRNGEIKGIVPKMFLPNAGEFNESRWFYPGIGIASEIDSINLWGNEIPFGNLLFSDAEGDFSFGIEVCHDAWIPLTPGTHLVLAGANTIFNPSASTHFAGKKDVRHNLIKNISLKDQCGYVYASAGPSESTQDTVFSGDSFIAELGDILSESVLLERDGTIVMADIDYEKIHLERLKEQNFGICADRFIDRKSYRIVTLNKLTYLTKSDRLLHKYSKEPFVPKEPEKADAFCREIFSIQSVALAERLSRTKTVKAVVGVSGGSDSTLALLVASKATTLLGRPASDVLGITMPGFGTTDKTYDNAQELMKQLGCEMREISIKESVIQHFKDIGHNLLERDITYENAQARERTQILMDVANQVKGMVIGTGDLSEAALGWCTFNGDHMSMYSVNAGIPKCLVQHTIATIAKDLQDGKEAFAKTINPKILAKILESVLQTPISPELLPPDENGDIAQHTEDSVGPYELHDFFLYHCIRKGMRPERVLFIAQNAFDGIYELPVLKKWLHLFLHRFFTQQFKRNCVPDGPKLISFGFSPRGDWRMPSDASANAWLSELE